jgi:hypothetical protein
MSRGIVVARLVCGLALGGCGAVAGLAGAPNHDVARVTIVLPSTIMVGDTVQATTVITDASGGQPVGDTTVTWSSSDPAAISVDATGRVTGDTPGAHATISAKVQRVTGTLAVTVGDDQRLGYALANQPSTGAPYDPDANYRYNSSGGAVEVARPAAGVYAVRFAGLGRQPGQRDNVQVTGYGGAGGTFCKLAGWQSAGSDLTADVRCFTPAGIPADSRFTILVSGARVYLPTSRLGFVLSPDFAGALTAVRLDTSGTTRNNSSGSAVYIGHNAVGDYSLQFPGLERVSGPRQGPETVQVTAVGAGPERCYLAADDPPGAGLNVKCTTTGGAPADSRFSVLLFQRGRPYPEYRFAYAWADRPGATADYTPNDAFWRNNSGPSILASKVAAGQYRLVFAGLARRAGDTETVLITPFPQDHICSTTSWGNSGGADLEATLSCFDANGAPADAQFNILVVQ